MPLEMEVRVTLHTQIGEQVSERARPQVAVLAK
jgi:hypothetical protein